MFLDLQMKQIKEDADSMIDHMSNDILNKEKLAVDEFVKNIDNSVSRAHEKKKWYIELMFLLSG